MKNIFFALVTFLVSTSAMAATEHYIRKDGNHVQHLKITQVGNDLSGSMDVNFEPNGATEADRKPCEAEISGDAKKTGDNEITIKKQIEGETKHCALKVQLTTDGAKVEQSPECGYFVAGICHFDSEGKELTKIK